MLSESPSMLGTRARRTYWLRELLRTGRGLSAEGVSDGTESDGWARYWAASTSESWKYDDASSRASSSGSSVACSVYSDCESPSWADSGSAQDAVAASAAREAITMDRSIAISEIAVRGHENLGIKLLVARPVL